MPDFGHAYRVVRIDAAVSIILRIVQPTAVPVVGAVVLPVVILVSAFDAAYAAANLGRRIGENVLHIAPAEIGIGLKHQGDNAGHDGRGTRGAAEAVGISRVRQPAVAVVQVGARIIAG